MHMMDCVAQRTRSKTRLNQEIVKSPQNIIFINNTDPRSKSEIVQLIRGMLVEYDFRKKNMNKEQRIDFIHKILLTVIKHADILFIHDKFRQIFEAKYIELIQQSECDKRIVGLIPQIMESCYLANIHK